LAEEVKTVSEHNSRVLIVDDEEDICNLLSRLMKREGLDTLVALEGHAALNVIINEMPDVLLADIKMPGMDGMELLKRAKEMDPDLPVVMITAHADVPGAVQAMKAGAHDYLAKPFAHHEVIRVTLRALHEREMKRKLHLLSDQLQESHNLREMMGHSDAVAQLITKVNRVAHSGFTVVIEGETGSGKELVAQAIHNASPRSGGPFVPVDCGAIPENLMESELFGHEKGAFTGADRQKPGKFELARGGTLFLDEVSNMALGSQAKLLRLLQEKRLFRVGGTKELGVDVRLIVATNKALQKASESGGFRHDLFFRLNEFPIQIPPLRNRKEDIPYLAKRFLDHTNVELNKMVKGFSDRAMEVLLLYDWPGNVRQLRTAIRRAVLMADDMVHKEHLDIRSGLKACLSTDDIELDDAWEGRSLKEIVQRKTLALERRVIEHALRRTGGNKAKAARLLHIDYKTMHTKIKQTGILNGGTNGWE
jgi:DNA-binding NtrC family response regulator